VNTAATSVMRDHDRQLIASVRSNALQEDPSTKLNIRYSKAFLSFQRSDNDFYKACVMEFIGTPSGVAETESWIRLMLRERNPEIQRVMLSRDAEWLGNDRWVNKEMTQGRALEMYRQDYPHLVEKVR
jgi:hypothetical protein